MMTLHVLAAACLSTPALASPAAAIDNAAVLYLRADPIYNRTGARDLVEAMRADNSAVAPGSEGAAKLIESQQAVNLAIRASNASECDFEVDYSAGFETLLPQLGQMRGLSYLVLADARRTELAGDLGGSVERTRALYRMADHITWDGVIINSLVGVAIANVAHEQAERLAGLEITDEHREMLMKAIEQINDDDPFEVVAAIRQEQAIVRDWVLTTFTGEDAAIEFFNGMTSHQDVDDDLRERFESMSEDEFIDQVNAAVDAYDEVVDAFRADDLEALKEIETRTTSGEFGAVASVMLPAFSNAAANRQRAIGDLVRVHDLLKGEDE